jgi:streptogrisin C
VDFDLYLYKWNGGSWSTVASATSPDPDETLSPGHHHAVTAVT